MKNNSIKYIYYFLLAIQTAIVFISLSLFLGIFNTGILFQDVNTSSMIVRILIFLFLQLISYKVLEEMNFKPNEIFTILILISISVISDAFGNIFGWYEMGTIIGKVEYDDILHFLLPLLLTFSIEIFLTKHFKKELISYVFSIATISFLICIWEIYEYWSDIIFHTTMLGDIHDTILDMTLGISGGILALILHILFKKFKVSRFSWEIKSSLLLEFFITTDP